MKNICLVSYDDIISMDNLLLAWREFILGKEHKSDVINFSLHLADNILQLHEDLAGGRYRHGGYKSFYITDPKRRHIHKAGVRDRLFHHAVCRQLYPFFAKTFISDSFSCQLGRGTHRAVARFVRFARQASQNHTKTAWVLKGDVRKFFENIDHDILLGVLGEYIPDRKIIGLLAEIVRSFEVAPGRGLPLGNLTSQLFANIYMNKFDQFVKHRLKAKYYIRYADDFVILSARRDLLDRAVLAISHFLRDELKLTLHPEKTFVKTVASGVDFLGWVNFPHCAVLRTKTKKRMLDCLCDGATLQGIASYLGHLRYGDTFKLRLKILTDYWFREK